MALATYSDLVAAVNEWAARGNTSFTSRTADFIALGEARIWKRLRVSDMVAASTLVVPAAQNWVALPADWLAFKRVRSSTEGLIEYLPADQIDDLVSGTGDASKYSVEGRRLIYGQTPTANLTLSIRYYQHPGAVATATPVPWLLTKSPGAYLYAALLESALFVKNSAKAGEWGTLLDKELADLDSADRAAMVSGGRLRPAGRM